MAQAIMMSLEDRIKLVEYLEKKILELERWGYLIVEQIERLQATISIQKDIIARKRPK